MPAMPCAFLSQIRSPCLLVHLSRRSLSHHIASKEIFQKQEIAHLAVLAKLKVTHLNRYITSDVFEGVLREHLALFKPRVASTADHRSNQIVSPSISSDLTTSLIHALKDGHGTLDTDHLLTMCFSWYEVGARALFEQGVKSIIERDLETFSTQQFCKLMLLIALTRVRMSLHVLQRVEQYFKSHMSTMSIEEISLYCYSLFRTQTQPIDEEIIRFTMEAAFTRFSSHEVVFSSLIKFLKFIKMRKFVSLLRQRFESIDVSKYTQSRDPYICVNLMKLGEYYYVYNETLYQHTLKTIPGIECRIKDLAEVLRCCLSMAHLPDDQILHFFSSKKFDADDLDKFSFVVSYATYLAYLGIMRDDLIAQIFSKPHLPEKKNYGYETNLLRLHSLLSIRHATKYQGKLLSAHQVEHLSRELIEKCDAISAEEHLHGDGRQTLITLKKAYNEACALFGDRVFMHRILPFTTNPEICIARDASLIDRIKKSPLGPNVISECTVLSIRQGGNYGDWRHTRLRYDHQVKEQLLAEMGFQVHSLFWADVTTATSKSLRRLLRETINIK